MKNRVEDIINTTDPAEKSVKERRLDRRIKENPGEKEVLIQEFQEALDHSGERIAKMKEEVDLKIKLKEVTEIISLSYIAKTYFHKSRQWLYQRINGNMVGGKTQKLTAEQMKTLDIALKDISKKIDRLSICG